MPLYLPGLLKLFLSHTQVASINHLLSVYLFFLPKSGGLALGSWIDRQSVTSTFSLDLRACRHQLSQPTHTKERHINSFCRPSDCHAMRPTFFLSVILALASICAAAPPCPNGQSDCEGYNVCPTAYPKMCDPAYCNGSVCVNPVCVKRGVFCVVSRLTILFKSDSYLTIFSTQ